MNDLEQARDLVGATEREISALRGMDDATVFADEILGFHVQQAAEKLFKAWLALLGETYPLSHDLAAPLDILEHARSGCRPFRRVGGLRALRRSLSLRGRRPGCLPTRSYPSD